MSNYSSLDKPTSSLYDFIPTEDTPAFVYAARDIGAMYVSVKPHGHMGDISSLPVSSCIKSSVQRMELCKDNIKNKK